MIWGYIARYRICMKSHGLNMRLLEDNAMILGRDIILYSINDFDNYYINNSWNTISTTGLLISWDGDGERDKYMEYNGNVTWLQMEQALPRCFFYSWAKPNSGCPEGASAADQLVCLWQFVAPEKSVKITVDRWFMQLIIGFQHVSTIQSRVMLLNDITLW